MTDEEQTPPKETGAEGVISIDPTAAAIKAVGNQPWAQEAGMSPASEASSEVSSEMDEVGDDTITKGVETTGNDPSEPVHVSEMEDSGMGTWTSPTEEVEAASQEPVKSEVVGLNDFGSVRDTRTLEGVAQAENLPNPVLDTEVPLFMPDKTPTTTVPYETTIPETTTTTFETATVTQTRVPSTTVPETTTTTIETPTTMPTVPVSVTIPGHTN